MLKTVINHNIMETAVKKAKTTMRPAVRKSEDMFFNGSFIFLIFKSHCCSKVICIGLYFDPSIPELRKQDINQKGNKNFIIYH